MTFRFIISVIVFSMFITCALIPVSAADAASGLSFGLETVAGDENEYILTCEGADCGPAGVFITFPGPADIVSTTLSESRYRVNGNTLACTLVDEDACSFRIICPGLQPGSLSISWEDFSGSLSGEAEISISDAGEVSVSASGDTGEMESDANQPSPTVKQSPFACIVFTAMVSLAVVCTISRRREEESQ